MSSMVPWAPSKRTDLPSSSARLVSSAVSQMKALIFSPSCRVVSTSAEKHGVEEVGHAKATASHLVLIGRADAARGRADFVGAPGGFRREIQFTVIRENQVRPIADVQASVNINAGFGERFDFVDKSGRINDHASPDDGMPFGAQDAAGNELENETIFVNDDRVAGVVPARNPRDVIKRTGEIIDDLSLAFIAPLRAYHDDRFHAEALLAQDRATRKPLGDLPVD